MGHYANDDRFYHEYFYDESDFLSSNKKILADELKSFADTFDKGKKADFGYTKFILVHDCTIDDYEKDILYHECLSGGEGIMTKDETDFFIELLFVKYVQPYIDAGYIVYDGKKTKPPIHMYAPAVTEDYWFPTAKCKIDYDKYVEEQKQKKYKAAIEKAAIEAGMTITSGPGKEAEFCNPDCYKNIPILTTEQIKMGIACFMISLPLAITVLSPVIAIIWIQYISSVYKDYKERQFAAERYYRVTHGLPYNEK